MNNSYIYIYHVNVTQTVPDISPLMPMHQDPLLVDWFYHAHLNYSDMNVSLSKKSPANRLFVQQFVQTDRMEKTPKLRITALLWGETTGDLWILPAKGKSLGERFHFMHLQVFAQYV